MPVSQFPFGSATSLIRALRQRKVSSLELLNAYLTRIDQVNPTINAVVVQDRIGAPGIPAEPTAARASHGDRGRSGGVGRASSGGLRTARWCVVPEQLR